MDVSNKHTIHYERGNGTWKKIEIFPANIDPESLAEIAAEKAAMEAQEKALSEASERHYGCGD